MLNFSDYENVLADELSTTIITDPDYSNIAVTNLSVSADVDKISSTTDVTHNTAADSAGTLQYFNSESYSVVPVKSSTEEMPPLYPDYSEIIPEWVLWTGWGTLVGITLVWLWTDRDKS